MTSRTLIDDGLVVGLSSAQPHHACRATGSPRHRFVDWRFKCGCQDESTEIREEFSNRARL